MADGTLEFEVALVKDHKYDGRRKKFLFLIQWKGYGNPEDTWEPEENLQNTLELLEDYKKVSNFTNIPPSSDPKPPQKKKSKKKSKKRS